MHFQHEERAASGMRRRFGRPMLKIKYICVVCNYIFSDDEAVCEDWRDKEKSFICPQCNTSLGKRNETREKVTYIFLGLSLTILLISMLMGWLSAFATKYLIGVVALVVVYLSGAFTKQKTYSINKRL